MKAATRPAMAGSVFQVSKTLSNLGYAPSSMHRDIREAGSTVQAGDSERSHVFVDREIGELSIWSSDWIASFCWLSFSAGDVLDLAVSIGDVGIGPDESDDVEYGGGSEEAMTVFCGVVSTVLVEMHADFLGGILKLL